jgi:hypothetical protein
MQWARWAILWLGLGFLLKWFQDRKKTMFDMMLILLSFGLIWMTFGALHLTIWQAIVVYLFWSVIVIMIKAE